MHGNLVSSSFSLVTFSKIQKYTKIRSTAKIHQQQKEKTSNAKIWLEKKRKHIDSNFSFLPITPKKSDDRWKTLRTTTRAIGTNNSPVIPDDVSSSGECDKRNIQKHRWVLISAIERSKESKESQSNRYTIFCYACAGGNNRAPMARPIKRNRLTNSFVFATSRPPPPDDAGSDDEKSARTREIAVVQRLGS